MTWNMWIIFPNDNSSILVTYINKSETTDLILCLFHDGTMFLIKEECVPGLISGCRLHFHPKDSHILWLETYLKMLQSRIRIIHSWKWIAPYISKSESAGVLCLYLFMMLPVKTNIPNFSPSRRLNAFLSHRLSHWMNSKKHVINY
jgi:hypothetical protein